ncbi:hypothetical protein WN51_01433 [Melipona quadrifasciata]|uniref:Trichohyalin-plectin-homology domain-containing protein n=1 Tax=Melipona quadrifasciata TaxID=166423 RepID=A0A0M8ZW50_9HYME|nr:hypothetical protein WN51_01433 [Melipona quadrifasciata]
MIREQNGKGDNDFARIKDKKAEEMEERRRLMEKSAEKKRQLRQQHIERKETLEAEKLQRAETATDLKIRQLKRRERLAEELARHIELQESFKSRKIKSATSRISDEVLEKMQAELMEKKTQDVQIQTSSPWDISEDLELKQQQKKLSYKRDLQNQLIDNRRRLREKEEEKHRERKIMEEVGETLHEENSEAEKRKRETATLLQAERDAFLKARQFWKEKRREVLKQEHDEIARIIAKREALQKREAEGKIDTQAAKDSMLERMMSKLMEEEHKRVEREEICRGLYLAEKEHERADEAIKEALKKKRTARELLQEMARTQKAVAERKAKEHAIDAAFTKYLADEQKKQEEKERLKEQTRREKVAQYGNELREIIEQNKMRRSKGTAQMKRDEKYRDTSPREAREQDLKIVRDTRTEREEEVVTLFKLNRQLVQLRSALHVVNILYLPCEYKTANLQSAIAQYQTTPLLLEVYATPPHGSRDPNQPIANFRCISVAPEEARFSVLPPLKSLSVIKSFVDFKHAWRHRTSTTKTILRFRVVSQIFEAKRLLKSSYFRYLDIEFSWKSRKSSTAGPRRNIPLRGGQVTLTSDAKGVRLIQLRFKGSNLIGYWRINHKFNKENGLAGYDWICMKVFLCLDARVEVDSLKHCEKNFFKKPRNMFNMDETVLNRSLE